MAKKKMRKVPAAAPLLVELLTEELPPKSVRLFGEVFADRVVNGLTQRGLITIRARGVRVFATARRLGVLIPQVLSKGQDRTNSARLMPAKVAFDAEGKPTKALLGFCQGRGVDVAIDNVGSPIFEPTRRSIAVGGRWLLIGQLTGQFVPFNPAQLFLKNVSMLSATSTTRKQLQDCLALVARGDIKPIVSKSLPLERAAEAHHAVEAGSALGRILLRPTV